MSCKLSVHPTVLDTCKIKLSELPRPHVTALYDTRWVSTCAALLCSVHQDSDEKVTEMTIPCLAYQTRTNSAVEAFMNHSSWWLHSALLTTEGNRSKSLHVCFTVTDTSKQKNFKTPYGQVEKFPLQNKQNKEDQHTSQSQGPVTHSYGKRR